MEKDLEIYVERKGRQETQKQIFMSQRGLSGASSPTPLTAAGAPRRAPSHVTHPQPQAWAASCTQVSATTLNCAPHTLTHVPLWL